MKSEKIGSIARLPTQIQTLKIMNRALLLLLLAAPMITMAQKPALDLEAIDQWKQLEAPQISSGGQWVSYELAPNQGDPSLLLYHQSSGITRSFQRSSGLSFSSNGRYAAWRIHPAEDSLKAMKRRGLEKAELPKDTLGLFSMENRELRKLGELERFLLPEKWDGWLAYQLAPMRPDTSLPDSVKIKKESEENGSRLVVRNLNSGQEDTLKYVRDFTAAEEAPALLAYSTGEGDSLQAGIYRYDFEEADFVPLLNGAGHYGKMALSRDGKRAAFLALRDTLKHRVTPYQLWQWQEGATAEMLADSTADFLPDGYLISEHFELQYSEDGSKLFFGMAPPPLLQDTSLLEEEIVQVEVWAYNDQRLYTNEEARLEDEKEKSFTCVFHQGSRKIVPLGSPELPEVKLGDEGNANFALGIDESPYLRAISWQGFPIRKDIYLIDTQTGKSEIIAERIAGNPKFSPMAEFVYWYNTTDSSWYAFDIAERRLRQLAREVEAPFYNELHDQPQPPRPYGIAGWTTEDDFIMIYDRYDIWLIDPHDNLAPNNLTKGRPQRQRFRYIKLDEEERSIEEVKPMLFHFFDEKDKSSGYVWFNIHTGVKERMQSGPYYYTPRVQKAREADAFLFSRESFSVFPDLLLSTDNLKQFKRISDANPQQKNYRWGQAEAFHWIGADGQDMEGILIKPEGFDPQQQYPMMTYFYERNADRLHRHPTPRYPRSVINWAYYASRGYVIFVPDVHYRVGYPGESALDAVTTGVTSVLEQGFVDRKRLGLQGHSWGGYQIAYLVTQTDLFRCAEAGAPVVNMTSAYGGIRWGSGLSRMFQYERSQSRIGGTLWEKPLRYIENSPLFYADKINTPLLILHNDEDGAVPWYQGIEFFVALRRLGKPAWLLNYNGNPHWVMGEPNRRDFMQRMQQFFDHYLLGAPMPPWMKEGVSPMEKGIEQGLGED